MVDQVIKGSKEDRAHDRRRIVVRAAVAAGLIAALMASLLMFEQPKKTDDAPAPPVASMPDIGVAVSGATSALSEDVQTAIKNAPDMAQTALASMSVPAESPRATSSAIVVPEGTKGASVKSSPDATPSPSPVRADPHTGKAVHGDRLVIEVPKPTPLTAAPVPLSATAKTPTISPSGASASGGFVVQLGVFNSITNAEELRAKLTQAGIPSQLETRVQVGPFSTKDEAVKAQDKLRALGLGGGILVPPKKP